ncbi:PhzF family phenazine biosynthesis protein [Gallaecimonas sp. GXIMD4217]|uniref:PhzF family phenazine biosynthesis protein n=1 Tax=Gallaecimonas sp. GXIMD4217 TaxID=3131927 RepID=UPI00311B2210
MSLEMLLVDAFTTRAYSGNPCAVFFDAGNLSESQMQRIAQEMNQSESAFIQKVDGNHVQARYFTPGEEIPMAGHPTVAVFHALLSTGRLDAGQRRFTLALRAGTLDIEVSRGDQPLITMTQLAPKWGRDYPVPDVATVVGLNEDDIRADLPVQTVSTGTPLLMVPVKSLAALERASLNQAAYQALWDRGDFFSIHLFVPRGINEKGQTFARHFALDPDPTEDPFTGSATGAMACYLWHHGELDKPAFTAQQGHWLGRPGQAQVEVLGQRQAISGVKVGGSAVTVMAGRLALLP